MEGGNRSPAVLLLPIILGGRNMKKYGLVYPDPPSKYPGEDSRSRKLKITPPYPTMSYEELASLPVRDIASKDCALAMWATGPMMEQAIKLIEAWGFRFITVLFVWVKTNPLQNTLNYKPACWTMPNAEYLLFGKIGHPKRIQEDIKQIVFAPIAGHSAKPPIFRDKLVNLFGDVPRIELFARSKAPGWDAIGNEIDGKDIRVALNDIINGKGAA